MTEPLTYNPEYIGRLVLYIRCAAIKFRIKQYYLYLLYVCYMQYKYDSKAYISRYVITFTLKPSSVGKVINDLIKLNLLVRISFDTFCFTSYSIEVLNYIDSQLSNLESK